LAAWRRGLGIRIEQRLQEAGETVRRRLIPFDAYMIATERLPAATVRALLPTNRTVIDCNHNIIYLRRSPDGARILFGGQTGARTTDLKSRAAALHRLATKILPGFGDLRLSYAWTGRCAGTFDLYRMLAGATASGTQRATASRACRWAPISAVRSRGRSWATRAARPFSPTAASRRCRSTTASRGSCPMS
jgi:glycine/D-amino acid oxidase-like deaminating enzyme